MPSSQPLTKLNDELTDAMQAWTDLVAAAKAIAWPSVDDLKDLVDASAAWQDLNTDIEALREQAKEVEHAARKIDEELARLTARMREEDPEIMSDDALVTFLSAAVPERRYDLVYDCQKLTSLTERIRAEGKVEASVPWTAQRHKILESAERGFHGCEWQLDEITKTLQADRAADDPAPAAAPDPAPVAAAPVAPEREHEARPEPHEQHHPGHEANAAEAKLLEEESGVLESEFRLVESEARLVESEAKPLEEEPAAVAESVTASASSGDSDARVEEDVLDGM